MLQKNDEVAIFQKPFTGEDFEGMGTLVKQVPPFYDLSMQYWLVHFADGTFPRWVAVDQQGDAVHHTII